LTFTFPTLFAESVRIGLLNLAISLAPRAAQEERGQCLFESACRHMEATPIHAPLFPRALSISVESVGRAGPGPGVDFVFLDYGPVLDLSTDPTQLRRCFGFLEPSQPLPQRQQSLDVLARMSAGFSLAHIGMGWRRDACLHKVYLRGRFAELVQAALERGAANEISPHAPELLELAEDVAARVVHLVVDESGGRVVRVGFELNFDVGGAEGFASLVTRNQLWIGMVPGKARGEVEALAGYAATLRPLDDGTQASLRLSHLKVSFDGSGDPEWKAYLCFQKLIAG
jgi:hypothetical protein